MSEEISSSECFLSLRAELHPRCWKSVCTLAGRTPPSFGSFLSLWWMTDQNCWMLNVVDGGRTAFMWHARLRHGSHGDARLTSKWNFSWCKFADKRKQKVDGCGLVLMCCVLRRKSCRTIGRDVLVTSSFPQIKRGPCKELLTGKTQQTRINASWCMMKLLFAAADIVLQLMKLYSAH